MATRRILITGCSGAGKSALLEEMFRRGLETIKEPGRRVIRAEERMGGKGLPWVNPERFAKLCLKIASADWDGVRAGTVLFDRGVFDAAVHLGRLGQEELAEGYFKTYPYDITVVLAAPWEELFMADQDRRHSFADAVDEYVQIAATLDRLGYDAQVIPEASVKDRADWLERVIAG